MQKGSSSFLQPNSLADGKTGVQMTHTQVDCQATFLSSSAPPRMGTQMEKASLYACTGGDMSGGQGVPVQ